MVLHSKLVAGNRLDTITEMSHQFGVSLRTLRFYEDKGLLQPTREGTSRYYSVRDKIRLELILKGRRLGFTLTEIHSLIDERAAKSIGDDKCITATFSRDDLLRQIEALERQRTAIMAAIDELGRALPSDTRLPDTPALASGAASSS